MVTAFWMRTRGAVWYAQHVTDVVRPMAPAGASPEVDRPGDAASGDAASGDAASGDAASGDRPVEGASG